MNCFQSISILAVCLGYVLTTSDFNCNRPSNLCVNGDCTENTGACSCPLDASSTPTHVNKDCSLLATSIVDPSKCSPPCFNGGNCYQESVGVYNCSCTTDYFGTQCETKRMATTCTGDSMTVTITPFPEFSGSVFVSNKTTVAECAFVKTVDEFEVTMTFAGNCGVETTTDVPNVGDTMYTNLIIIRSSNFMELPFDISLIAKCTHYGSGISNVTDNIATVSVNEAKNLTSEIAEATYKPVTLNIQTPSGGNILSNVYIGDHLRLFIPLSDTGKYSKLIITDLSVHNGLLGTNRIEVPLITNKCQTSDGKTVITGMVIFDSATPALIINFKAFKVVGSESLNFIGSVTTCKADDNSCDAATCPSKRRRKRDVASKLDENNFVLKDSIVVLDPLSMQEEPNAIIEPVIVETPAAPKSDNVFSDPEKCLESKEILVMVIVLVVAVVLLLVITTCLAVRFIKSRAQVKVTDHTNLMSSDMNMVKIPRPTI